jgi:hypothetical protein
LKIRRLTVFVQVQIVLGANLTFIGLTIHIHNDKFIAGYSFPEISGPTAKGYYQKDMFHKKCEAKKLMGVV